MPEKAELVVEGKKLAVSNLNKVLYPKVGFTKGQVIDYYIRIAPVLLPHLARSTSDDEALSRTEWMPNSFTKNCPSHRPKWVQTAKVWSEGNNRIMHYCLAQDLPTLVWAANLADLELHTSLAKKKDVARPDHDGFRSRSRCASRHCAMLSGRALAARFVKQDEIESVCQNERLEGSASVRAAEYVGHFRSDQGFVARSLPNILEGEHGNLVTSNMSQRRCAKERYLLIGVRTTNTKQQSAFTRLRAKEEPTVSTPVTWDGSRELLEKEKADLLKFRSDKTLSRVEKMGDLFAAVERVKTRSCRRNGSCNTRTDNDLLKDAQSKTI